MLKGSRQATLKKIVQRLRRHYQPKKIILFGSLARGEEEEWGDIDLIVIANDKRRFMTRQREAALLLADIEEDIDIFIYTPQEWQKMNEHYNPFTASIQRHHQVIYERPVKKKRRSR